MTNYYLDIETDTEGRNTPDPLQDKIITIQYRPYYDYSGKPKEPLEILRSWESSEKDITRTFLDLTEWTQDSPNKWGFIPTGFNLGYDLTLIRTRSKELLNETIPYEFLFRVVPKMDLKTIIVMANNGKFKGSSLDKFSKKLSTGRKARHYIQKQDWDNLLKYITTEANAFFEIYQKLIREIPKLLPKSKL